MPKYKVTLEITTELNPNKWNWSELSELCYEVVGIEKMEEANA